MLVNSYKDLIPKSFLQSGNDLIITKDISFKHPTIQEIFDLDKEHLGLRSEEIYYSMINLFLTDPYDYMVYLDDKGIDYETVTDFDVFCMLYKDYIENLKTLSSVYDSNDINAVLENNIYTQTFKFFFGVDRFYTDKDENENIYFLYGNYELLFNIDVYKFISEFVRKVNGIPEDDKKIFPEDAQAKMILIEDKRDEMKRSKKKKDKDDEKPNNDRLGNLLSSVTWSCNGGITPFNRNQLHMYDLVDGINRTDKLLQYKNTMTGLYSGCVDKKKLDFKELHWSS